MNRKVLSDAAKASLEKLKAMDPSDLIAKVDRSYNVAVIGHVDHGKTTLTSSLLTEISQQFGLSIAKDYNSVKRTEEERVRGVTIVSSTNESFFVDDDGKLVRLVLIDCPGHRDFIKNMVTGASNADFCILTVAASKGVEPQTLAHLQLIRSLYQAKKTQEERALGIVLTQTDLVGGDADLVDLVQAEVDATLDPFRDEGTFSETVFFQCSAYEALQGNADEKDNVFTIADKIINEFPRPTRLVDQDLSINVEQIYNVPGRGMVAAGTVTSGIVKPGDSVDVLIPKSGKVHTTKVTSVEAFKKQLPQASAGDNIGLLLRMVDGLDKMEKGSVIAKIGTIPLKRGFIGTVYLYDTNEGGRSSKTLSGFQPSFFYSVQQYTVTLYFLTGLSDEQQVELIELVKGGSSLSGADAQSNQLRKMVTSGVSTDAGVFDGAEPGSDHKCIVVLNDTKCRIPLKVGSKGTGQEGHQNRMAFSIAEVF